MKKNIWILLLFVIGILLIVPLTVNILFKIETNTVILQAEWSADALLGYIGALFGAFATIVAVILTIRFTKEQQRQENIIAARPWLVSNSLRLNSNEAIQAEENTSARFIYLSDGSFVVSITAPFNVKRGTHKINKEDCVVKYCIKNVGGNTATNFSMSLDGAPLLPNTALALNSELILILSLPLKDNDDESRYTLCFSYGDIVSEMMYFQKETLIIKKDKYGVTFAQTTEDFLTGPIEQEVHTDNG